MLCGRLSTACLSYLLVGRRNDIMRDGCELFVCCDHLTNAPTCLFSRSIFQGLGARRAQVSARPPAPGGA